MKIKVGDGPWCDTKFDWGYKSDQHFALAMYKKKLELEQEIDALIVQNTALKSRLDEIKSIRIKKIQVSSATTDETPVEAIPGELINNYAIRLANYASANRCRVTGNFNNVKLSGGSNTSADYYIGYFWGVQKSNK